MIKKNLGFNELYVKDAYDNMKNKRESVLTRDIIGFSEDMMETKEIPGNKEMYSTLFGRLNLKKYHDNVTSRSKNIS